MEQIQYLTELWRNAGVNLGDTLLLHSNILRTLMNMKRKGYKPRVEYIFDSFMDAVGSKGTLILPLFNFEFTKGVTFDIKNTVSQMGALTEEARKRDGVVRTGHPIYSFAVIGENSGHFENVDNYSAYAENSPFGMLKKMDGKIAVLDLEEQNSMTFYHHIEEVNIVDYRYFKEFSGQYIEQKGKQIQKTYSIYVRDLNKGVETHINPAGELLWHHGLYRGDRPNEMSGLRVINAKKMFKFISELIANNQAYGNLYLLKNSK